MTWTEQTETLVTNHLYDLRGEAQVYRHTALAGDTPVARELFESFAVDLCARANALLTALRALGVRGLPEPLVLWEGPLEATPPAVLRAQLAALEREQREREQRVGQLRRALHAALLREVVASLPHPPARPVFGTQPCSGVAEVCVYDEAVDPAFDDCLFCGEPDERK